MKLMTDRTGRSEVVTGFIEAATAWRAPLPYIYIYIYIYISYAEVLLKAAAPSLTNPPFVLRPTPPRTSIHLCSSSTPVYCHTITAPPFTQLPSPAAPPRPSLSKTMADAPREKRRLTRASSRSSAPGSGRSHSACCIGCRVACVSHFPAAWATT